MEERPQQAGAVPDLPRTPALWTLALVIAGLVVSLSGILTDRPMDTHEIFAAQTAREMIASGDWVHPTFNEKPRLNKPPLQYWIIGGLATVTGQGRDMPAWVARCASMLAGLGLIVVTTRLGRAVFDAQTGLLGAALFVGTIAFFEYTNSARAEMLYALTCTAMLACLVRAQGSPDRSRPQLLWALAAWAWVGVSVLAKGPHVPLLMMAGFGVAMAWGLKDGRRILRVIRPFSGLLVAAAISAPWIAAMILGNDDLLAHWSQQLFSDRPVDEKLGIWNFVSPFYLYMFPALILPVSVLLPFGLAAPFQKNRPDLRRGLLILGPLLLTVLVMGFFTHRRDYYLLGLAAPACVLCARGVRDFLDRRPARLPAGRILAGFAVASMLALAIAGRTRLIWGENRWNKAAFARQIVDAVGDDPVLFFRADSDAFVYLLSRPLKAIRQPEALVEAVSDGRDWVVMSEKQIPTLPEGLTAEITLRMETAGTDDPPLVLARVRAQD